MASGRRVHGGKSFGRGQAVINFALDAWEEFDSWCLIRNVNEPWKLPSYRFGALVVYFMKEEKTEESVKMIDQSLLEADNLPHPFFDPKFRRTFMAMTRIFSRPVIKSAVSIDNVIYDPRLVDDIPIEERKRQEARARGKAFRVPEWWRGEKANYQVAKQMMVALPKKVGKPVPEK